MTDRNSTDSQATGQRLEKLRQRLDEARERRKVSTGDKDASTHAAAHHLVLRLLADMGVAMGAGALLGHGADSYFGTRPWGLLVGVLLGLAAGVRNVMHTADAVSRRAKGESGPNDTGSPPDTGMPSVNGKNAQNDGT